MSILPETEPSGLTPFPQAAYFNIEGVEGITGTITVRIPDEKIGYVNDHMKNALVALLDAGYPVTIAVIGADRDEVKAEREWEERIRGGALDSK